MLLIAATDIHGDIHSARMLVRAFHSLGANLLVVTGDACSKDVLREIAKVRSLYVSGNMDDRSVILEAERLGILLDDRSVSIEGYTFVGLTEKFKELPKGKWVLLSHYPPKDTEADRIYSGRHVGSPLVRKVIEEARPIACLCGHIHESPTISRLGDTLIVNPGPAFRGRAVLVDLSARKAKFIGL